MVVGRGKREREGEVGMGMGVVGVVVAVHDAVGLGGGGFRRGLYGSGLSVKGGRINGFWMLTFSEWCG